ncbi:OX-2 membrane glycoprotein-like [Notothenia coriiceps]|uniref:OX-2 membrane glycoprotein-like n=1 Tax=Notothenia coriiceps TaxID=8208 RepID=A0A6I9Q601_9TELE|nr:PREDICTED: OX-2 membrane glycoprotein-like [Notothenia coriiceps]
MAAMGEESCLQCQLMQTKTVLQVTWQKVLPAGEDNIATYTTKFGQTVNANFKGRVEFKTAGLQNCSINIMNVTDRDEGCYRCLFNTIPEGAFIGRTCLQIYELHEPFLHVVDSVVSCSATGRPAPTVTLTLPHNNSTSVANSNGTFTVTVTARLHNNSREVGCNAQVLTAPQKEASMTIPEVKMLAIKGSEEDSRSDNSGVALALIIVSVVLSCVCVAVAITAFLCIRKHLRR